MKGKRLSIIVFLCVFITFTICSVVITRANNEIIKKEAILTESKVISGFYTNMQEPKNGEQIISKINSKINDSMRQKLSQYKVIFTELDMDAYPEYYTYDKDTKGVYNPNKKEIVIHYQKYDDELTEQSFYHQLGLAIDSEDYTEANYSIAGSKYSSSTAFVQLFEQEGNELRKKFIENTDKRKEAFAECFSVYMMYPSYMERQAPNLYNYIKAVSSGHKLSGWIYNSGTNQYVYMKDNSLVKGWFTDPKTGKKYHFDDNGIMEKSKAIGNVKLGSDGAVL